MSTKQILRLVGLLFFVAVLLAAAQPAGVQALLGDLNISGAVDNADLAIIDAAYGTHSSTTPLPPNWDVRADINLDGGIDLSDLALAGRSFADPFNFHFQRRVSNGRSNNPLLTNPFWCDAAADLLGRVHVIWQESTIAETPLYYTLLDSSGNALIEDVLISNDSDKARLAVGPDGSTHIVFLRRFSNVGMYYTVMNDGGGIVSSTALVPDGSFAIDGGLATCSNCDSPALAVDEYNHGHLAYQKLGNQAMYTIQGTNSPLLPAAQLNPGSNHPATAFAVAVSPDGARHILWRQATGVGGGDLRYTRISKEGVVTTNNLTIASLEGMYNDRRFYLAADSQNAVHFLYSDFRSSSRGIYWRRANADGTLSDEKLISNNIVASASVDIPYAIDPSDRIHLLSSWESYGDLGYARLDRDGNILVPFQRTAFSAEQRAVITIDGSGRAMIVASSSSSSSPEPLFIVSTVSDPAANDPNRADLVLDRSHLVIANHLLKINESADIRVTITNGGPSLAAGIILTFTYPDLGGTTSHIDVHTADLAPFTSREIQQLIPVPDFEEVDSWEVSITVSTTTLETTTSNNAVTAPFGVFPPPRMFNLEILPYDETYAPSDRADAERLPGAKLDLNCPATGYTQTIAATDLYNVFWDIPLNMEPANGPLFATTCSITLSKAGFSSVSTTVTAQRRSDNPYSISLSLAYPLSLYINTWGQISGSVSCEGTPLRQVQLKLDSGQTTLTAEDGSYSFEKIPAGNHTLRVWAKGHTPIPDEPVNVYQGETTNLNISMVITFQADVFGVVVNEYGLPLVGARVKFYGDTTLIDEEITGNNGTFAFTVAHFENYDDYRLETSLTRYDPSTVPLPLMYSGLPLEQNVVLSYTVIGGDLTTSSRITSWAQDERWCQSYGKGSEGEDLTLRVEILETVGSEWCPKYQATVDWGAFDYDLGLNFTAAGDAHTVNELLIQFSNYEFISYDVSSGIWHSGGESRSVTAERIDWVELIAVDGDGNPQSAYAWRDDSVLYSSEQDNPASAQWRLTIDTLAPDWSLAAIRIFYTVGQYVEGEGHHFKNWAPPADLGLQGSGSASGANQQVITWYLDANTSGMRYSLADYRSALYPPAALAAQAAAAQPSQVAKPEQPAGVSAIGTVAVAPVVSGPAHVGAPFAVDITLTGFETRPVYALQFSLAFNTQYLRLLEIRSGLDFGGPSGSWTRALDVAAANAAGKLTSEAAVRLAAPTGLSSGRVVRLIFLPIKMTPIASSTTLDLQSIYLADLDSDLFSPSHVTDLSGVVVDKVKVFLPMVKK